MKKMLLIFAIWIFSISVVQAYDLSVTEEYLLKNISNPTTSSIGGEWSVLGIARNGNNKLYEDTYYKNLEEKLEEKKGILSERKYTEYSRAVIALTAINKNPENVFGYNLVSNLSDYDKVIKQGVNGAIFALIAVDTKNYSCDVREKYIDYILSRQLLDGGFSLNDITSDVDVTAMAVQALSNYMDNDKVGIAIENAVLYLSNNQNEVGGYDNVESIAQVIVALCEMNVDIKSEKFIKNGNNLIDALLSFRMNDGSFKHLLTDKTGNLMSTEQAFYAMVAYDRYVNGKTSLYDMSDIENIEITYMPLVQLILKSAQNSSLFIVK